MSRYGGDLTRTVGRGPAGLVTFSIGSDRPIHLSWPAALVLARVLRDAVGHAADGRPFDDVELSDRYLSATVVVSADPATHPGRVCVETTGASSAPPVILHLADASASAMALTRYAIRARKESTQ